MAQINGAIRGRCITDARAVKSSRNRQVKTPNRQVAWVTGASSHQPKTVFRIDPTALELEKEVAQTDTGAEKMLEKVSEKILEVVRLNSEVIISELAKETGVTTRTVERHIKRMQGEGILERIGGRKEGHWKTSGKR
jgi:ATP-dependent DNA helicase RecG